MGAPLTTLSVQDFPDEFFIDVAVGVSPFAVIAESYGFSSTEAEALASDPDFKRRLNLATKVVEDDGSAFKARCRKIVSDRLAGISSLMGDPDTPATVQLDAFKTLVKFGELEPVRGQAEGGSAPVLSLVFVAPDGHRMSVLPGVGDERIIDATTSPVVIDDSKPDPVKSPALGRMFAAS